jgi:hypothetical protein
MATKKNPKSGTRKKVRDLSVKAVDPKKASRVKGGFSSVEHGSPTGDGKPSFREFSVTKQTD